MIQQLMIKQMEKEAKTVVEEVYQKYMQIKKENPKENESYILKKTIFASLNIPEYKITKELDNYIGKYCNCLESVCYFIGFSSGVMKNAIILRCAQYIKMIDRNLYARGISPCSDSEREIAYKASNMYELYVSHPEAFN